jgi:hypothetical protein
MELRNSRRSEFFIYVTHSGIILLPGFIVEPGTMPMSTPVTGIDGRIPVVIGIAAKKSYL